MKLTPVVGLLMFGSCSNAVLADDFSVCVANLQNMAREEGLSKSSIATLDKVRHLPSVISLDRQQPEFNKTFAQYYNSRVTPWHVQQGRRLLQELKPQLEKLTQKYGVPGPYLLAFWGMETNFGNYKGNTPILDSLATLACDDRRSEFFTKELMHALELKEQYHLDAKDMVGSWAGAMGHTQFMPSTYKNYGVDGSGDGKADLWNSSEDALASAAHFLQELGWNSKQRWGREVLLPEDFSYSHLGESEALTLASWAKMGLTKANGQALPTLPMSAALYLPAGHKGPAFLVYDNFNVIMDWNRSVFYSISVGELANRINGEEPLIVTPPEQPSLSAEEFKAVQRKLIEQGYDVGKVDGIMGTNSMAALLSFQRNQNLIADGFPGNETFKSLGLPLPMSK